MGKAGHPRPLPYRLGKQIGKLTGVRPPALTLVEHQRLGVRLVDRTTRRLAPTEAGRAYYERVTGILSIQSYTPRAYDGRDIAAAFDYAGDQGVPIVNASVDGDNVVYKKEREKKWSEEAGPAWHSVFSSAVRLVRLLSLSPRRRSPTIGPNE